MGLASAEEAKLVADMVARYPEVKAELKVIEDSMENFDQKNAVEPPAHLKEKILAKVSGTPFPVSGNHETKVVSIAPQKQSNVLKYAAAIAIILLTGSVLYNLSLSNKLNEQETAMAQSKNTQDSILRSAKQRDSIIENYAMRIDNMVQEMTILKAPGMKSIELKGMQDVAPDAKAMAYANTTTGEVYLEIRNLPEAPEGMQYQFWGIVGGTPVNAGMIALDSDTYGIHSMTAVPNAVAYAISLEPKGGSPSPTGKIYVMGNS
jgi:anti-sigma-K factor RskA